MKDRNWVAKHSQQFNKAVVMRDKKKDYIRKQKHRYQETE